MARANSGLAAEEIDHDLAVKDFGGVNTQAARTAIGEGEFSWLENAMPVGYANLKAVPSEGRAVASFPLFITNYMKYVNVLGVDYMICFTNSGSGHVVNLGNYLVTQIAAPAVFVGKTVAAQWKNERVLIAAMNGYWSWEPVGGLVSLGGITGAPTSGSTIATFSGRVWVGFNRTMVFSAPNSYQDFATASSGGSFIVTDETLHSNINALLPANNFLYLIGDSSFNVISDVRIGTGSPAPTIFSNTNISALIGSKFPLSIFPYYRTIAFATPYGFYAMLGATPQKISDNLDGIIPFIDFTKPVSGGVANIFSTLLPCFAFNYTGPDGVPPSS